MKRSMLLVPILLLGACAKYPVQPMGEGEAMVLTKPIKDYYRHQNDVIGLTHAVRSINGVSKPDSLHTAMHVPAAANVRASYTCTINRQSAWSYGSIETLKAGSCYIPVIAYINEGSPENSAMRDARIIAGEPINIWGNKWCGFELAEVDCDWLKGEAASHRKKLKTPPVFVNKD